MPQGEISEKKMTHPNGNTYSVLCFKLDSPPVREVVLPEGKSEPEPEQDLTEPPILVGPVVYNERGLLKILKELLITASLYRFPAFFDQALGLTSMISKFAASSYEMLYLMANVTSILQVGDFNFIPLALAGISRMESLMETRASMSQEAGCVSQEFFYAAMGLEEPEKSAFYRSTIGI